MLLDLFLCFFQVGLFSIGGGYAAMPMIQSKAVEYYHWLNMSEFTDLMTIAEMTPGPITVNSATFVGIRMAGIPGALVATIGCIFPSLIIVSLISWLYERYRSMDAMQAVLSCLRPAVVALIASAALTILRVVVFANGRDCAFLGAAALLRAVCRGAGRFAHPSQQSDFGHGMLRRGVAGGENAASSVKTVEFFRFFAKSP